MVSDSRIPVIMYHGVGHPLPGWIWYNLTTKVDLFTKQIDLLIANKYSCITLDAFKDRQTHGWDPKDREVVLTFDDGFLDNWVYAYPILKKRGWKGTVYVNPDFIDPSEEPRPTLEDVWAGRCREEDLQTHGFLNRSEIRLLQESGVLSIGSHSNSHTWYYSGPHIIDYHRPKLSSPWLSWNTNPSRKHAYLSEDQSVFVPWGTPIYEHGRSLGIRQYFPTDNVGQAAIDHVTSHGGKDFFDGPTWKTRLDAAIASETSGGRYETDEEMFARFREEIAGSKATLEDIIGEDVKHFCWPGGAYCPESWPLAKEAGYATICVASRGRADWITDEPSLVHRIGAAKILSTPWGRYRTDDPEFLLLACDIDRGLLQRKWQVRFKKFLTAARAGFSPIKE